MQTESFSYKWWALIGLGLLSFTAFLDFTIVTTALPFIQKSLNANVLQLQWIMTIFAMMMCMFMIIAGKSGDLFGRKKVFYLGFILFGISAVGAANANSIQMLIFFRAVQGLGSAIIATVGVALLPQAFPENEQVRAIGIFSAFNGAGLAAGPFLGGILITLFSWRAVFWVNIPIIMIGLLFCSFSLKPSPKTNHKIKIDILGLIFLIVGLGCLIYGIVDGEQNGWGLIFPWLTILIGIISLIILVIVENKVEQPLLDLTLFKNHHAALSMLVCIAAGLIIFVFMFFDPLYLQLMRKQDAFMVGLTLLCVPVVQVVISLLIEKLVKRFNILKLLIFALISALLAAQLHVFFTPSICILFILPALMLMGYTWGICNVGSIFALTQSVASEKMGEAIGTLFTLLNIAGAIFLALSTVLFHWRENAKINFLLSQNHVVLTAEQHQKISMLLSDPQQVHMILKQFSGSKGHEVYQAFHSSFMSGFSCVALASTVIMLLIFLIGVRLVNGTNP
ncbi:MAG: MFS transporter [Gammaproteobacteria bacterium]|nr:MFS transporter [Gammaproteobacteria bacterium]